MPIFSRRSLTRFESPIPSSLSTGGVGGAAASSLLSPAKYQPPRERHHPRSTPWLDVTGASLVALCPPRWKVGLVPERILEGETTRMCLGTLARSWSKVRGGRGGRERTSSGRSRIHVLLLIPLEISRRRREKPHVLAAEHDPQGSQGGSRGSVRSGLRELGAREARDGGGRGGGGWSEGVCGREAHKRRPAAGEHAYKPARTS